MTALRLPEAASSTSATSVADVLTTLGHELERIRVLGLRVEQTICTIAVRSSLDTALIAELQHLDAVLQHVAALRDFSEQVALQCDDQTSVDITEALGRVTLADVRARLAQRDLDGNDEGWEIL